MFHWCGSFGLVADKGRWGSIQTCRVYITTALAEVASEAEKDAMRQRFTSFTEHLHWI